ncbi:phosphoadenylyl-sulfate reductase [Tepidamorphus sp. 3E244]|uniref:phosphoadenylyl-sulfate reductase n=1 Tax=Tepidamorphus sp. 3E244 TaxID=3385498 RepID=UPI0038FC3C16
METALHDTARQLDAELREIDALPARLRHIAQAVPGRVAFSTSLGIEDQVVLAAIAAADADVDVFTLDTGRHFPETLETLDMSEARYGRQIRVVFPESDDVEQLVARDGIFGFRNSLEARRACCDVRKVRPLNRALQGASGWITGLRSGQATTRAEVPLASADTNLGLIKISPLGDWSLERIEAYADEHAVPRNPLHARGFPSIGCQPCTRAIEPGEDIRAGRWWWENAEHKECGLHSRPRAKGQAA